MGISKWMLSLNVQEDFDVEMEADISYDPLRKIWKYLLALHFQSLKVQHVGLTKEHCIFL